MHDLFDPATVLLYLPKLLAKLPVTLLIVLSATAAGILFGLALAFVRLYRVPVLNQATLLYISFVRGTPIIVQMFLVYYGLPMLMDLVGIDINRWDKLFFVVVTYGLHAAAYYAEIFRGAIGSVPAGQAEAAYSVGLTRFQAFRRIVAPQAVLTAVPNVGTAVAGLLQDTSLAFTIGIIDVMGEVKVIGGNTHRMLEGYTGAALIFLVLALMLERTFFSLETRLRVMRHA
jgi:L-cystine transport system permease protein